MLLCWKCGTSLAHLSLPLTRRDRCRQCNADLHTCKLCEFYDVSKAKHCKEVIAEEVHDKGHANFCDYFKPKPTAYLSRQESAIENAADRARAELDALFSKK
jgi:hypothetical protein